MSQKIVEALVDGGKATPSPPLGPQLAMFKVNIGKVIQDINEKTKEYEGMKVPVRIIIDDETKEYKIEVGTPPVSSLIRKELGLEKIAIQKKEDEKTEEEEVETKGEKQEKVEKPETEEEKVEEGRVIVGNLTIDQCIKIAKMKRDSLLAKSMKGAVKEVVASCVSMPITVEGKNPKEVLREIDEGKYDDKIQSSGRMPS
jgi:large subunit ribosomal protein L11